MSRMARLRWNEVESKLALRKHVAHGATEMERSGIEVALRKHRVHDATEMEHAGAKLKLALHTL